ncbi:MAG: C40 family peptidase [Candidatus Oleimicrobiaceae bacterium]
MRWWYLVWVGLAALCGCSYLEPAPRPWSDEDERPRQQEAFARKTQVAPTHSDRGAATSAEAGALRQPRRTWTGLSRQQILALAEEIKAFLDAPYVWGGSSPEGTDCSGFVYAVFRRAWGLVLPRSAEGMFAMGEPVEKDSLRFSDLVFFEENGRGQVGHVGIYVAKGLFVHASPSKGVIISDLDEQYFRRHYIGARRLVAYIGH